MSENDLAMRMGAAALGRALAAGELDAVAVTGACYERIESDAHPHVFISLTKERAMAAAQASAARLRAGRPLSALDGVPIALKDLIDLEGAVTTAASDIYRNAPPATASAPCAEALEAAGMVVLGKTNLTEFAFSGLGLNPHFGTPRNPCDTDVARVPGGSSSGSAVAVAAGLAPCAIGTDTGGSVRVPAALNGLVGFKTSEGRIGKSGVFALSRTLDTVGPLARSVEDCALLEAAMRRAAPSYERRDLTGLRIVIPETIALDDLEPAVAEAFEDGARRLETAGAHVARRAEPLFDEMLALTRDYGSIVAADAYTEFHDLMEGPEAARIDRRVTARVMGGAKMTARDVLMIQRGRARLQAALTAKLDGALMAMPTVAHVAPEIAPLEADDDLFGATNLKTLRNTMIGNFFNLCGLSLPLPVAGPPIGLLLNAPGGQDDLLLSCGFGAERALSPAG